jgi:hypothetical protein
LVIFLHIFGFGFFGLKIYFFCVNLNIYTYKNSQTPNQKWLPLKSFGRAHASTPLRQVGLFVTISLKTGFSLLSLAKEQYKK